MKKHPPPNQRFSALLVSVLLLSMLLGGCGGASGPEVLESGDLRMVVEASLPEAPEGPLYAYTLEEDPEAYEQMRSRLIDGACGGDSGCTVLPGAPYADGVHSSMASSAETGDIVAMMRTFRGHGMEYFRMDRLLVPGDSPDPGADSRWRGITETVPEGMTLSPGEAAEQLSALAAPYTPFRAEPYKITACQDRDSGQGYYNVILQLYYEDRPLCPLRSDSEPMTLTGQVSEDGPFSCVGNILLRETARREVTGLVPFEEIYESFRRDFGSLISGEALPEELTLREIRFEYLCRETGPGVYELFPGWSFWCEGIDSAASGHCGTDVYSVRLVSYDGETGEVFLSSPVP